MDKKYSIIGVVPARLASTRLPEKMLADLNGIPLVAMTAKRAMESGAFDQVVVATDSEKIVKAVEKCGFKAFLTDPALPSGTCRVGEVAKQLIADVYVNIQGDEPLIDGEGLKRVAESFKDPKVEMATLSFPFPILKYFLSFPVSLLLLISSFTSLWSEKILDTISVFLSLLGLVL